MPFLLTLSKIPSVKLSTAHAQTMGLADIDGLLHILYGY